MQNCICFATPCINLLCSAFRTREYLSEVLELRHLLRCIASHLQHALAYVSGETYSITPFLGLILVQWSFNIFVMM